MDFKFLISFGVGLAIYLVGLLVYVLIKRSRNKKSVNKEIEESEKHDEEEHNQ